MWRLHFDSAKKNILLLLDIKNANIEKYQKY